MKRMGKKSFLLLAACLLMVFVFGISVAAAPVYSETMSVDAEAAVKPQLTAPGKAGSELSYMFDAGKNLFVLPVTVGANQDVHLEVTVQGASEEMLMLVNSNPSYDTVMGWAVQLLSGDSSMKDKVGTPLEVSGKPCSTVLSGAKGSTQYVYISKNESDYGKSLPVKVRVYQYKTTKNKSTVSLAAKKWKSAYHANGTLYFKLKVKSAGIVKVEYAAADQAKATLLNARKKTLGKTYTLKGNSISGDEQAFYSVKAGTYYLQVKSTGDVKLRYTFTKVTEVKNTTQKKALKLKSGKGVRTILTSGTSNKSYKWYQLDVKKTGDREISIQNTGSDTVTVALYKKGSSKALATRKVYVGEKENLVSVRLAGLTPSTVRLEKGTYYLRVSKAKKAESVSAVLTWE